MDIRIIPRAVAGSASGMSKRNDMIASLVERAVTPQDNHDADQLARSLHAVIAVLDGHRD